MAQTAKTPSSRLTPSPKVLQKALEQSARQAQKLADAFGVVVPEHQSKAQQPLAPHWLNGVSCAAI